MKFFLPFVVLAVISGVWLLNRQEPQTITTINHISEESDIAPYNAVSVSYNRTQYAVHYSNISDYSIRLIPNFTAQKSAAAIVDEQDCSAAINGGFYTEQDTPLGLFRHDGNQIGNVQEETNLIKAFFYLDDEGNPHIGWEYPDSAETVLQSGPYYFSDDHVSTVNDKPARRIVLIESTTGDFYIAALTTKDLTTSGPYLSDIGAILFSITEPFVPISVLNLDGGAASYYRGTDGYELSELTHVGSIICVE